MGTPNCAGGFAQWIPPDVSPQQGLATVITVGGAGVMVIPPGAYGGYIWNPYTAGDQGIGIAEPIYVNPLAAPSLQGFGATMVVYPGADPYRVPVPKSTYGIWVNAASSGHRFTVVYWTGP